MDLWAAQLQVDAAAGDAANVNGDSFSIDYVRDRVLHALTPVDVTRVNTELEGLSGAVGDRDMEAVDEAAGALRATLAAVSPRA